MILVQSTRPHTRVHRASLPEQNDQRRLHRFREEEQRAADDLRRRALFGLIRPVSHALFASTAAVHVHVKLWQSPSQPLTQVSYADSLEIEHVPQRGPALTAA